MIRVAANLAWLVPGRVGGSEEYTVRLLRAVLADAPDDLDLTLIGSPALFAAYPDLAAARCVVLRGPQRWRPFRVFAESTSVYRATSSADVVHHFGGRIPARHHGNDVVTIHDLQPLQMPENFSATKQRYLAWALPRSARSARLVLTPSEWVASTVVDLLGVEPIRVRAVSSTWDDVDDSDPALADSLGDGPVVLYPAVTHPHKRHTLLLAAMERVVRERPDVTLVLTGGEGRAHHETATAVAASPGRVEQLGRVSAASLRGLFRRADVLAFPSAYEGFGLPVLEAMRAGLPVVAADRSALREIIGDTGTLVGSDDPQDWATAIVAALDRDEERVERARRRADQWSPAMAAGRLLAVWRELS